MGALLPSGELSHGTGCAENTSHLVDLNGPKGEYFANRHGECDTDQSPPRRKEDTEHHAADRAEDDGKRQRVWSLDAGEQDSRHHETHAARGIYKQPENQAGIG